MARAVKMKVVALGCALAFGACGVAGAAGGDGFPLLDGERRATIVGDSGELALYLQAATGREFTVVSEDDFQPGEGVFPIYAGNCRITRDVLGRELAGLDRDGFMIVVESDRVFLAGRYAIDTFLEDYVGVRWLMPGPLGEDVLPRKRIVISPVRRVEEPVILARLWSGDKQARIGDRRIPLGKGWVVPIGKHGVTSLKTGRNWSRRQRICGRHEFSHNLALVFDPEKYYDAHPEYYALRDGKRPRPAKSSLVFPCWTSRETVKVAAAEAREVFDNDPARETFSLGPEDYFKPCQCRNCEAHVAADKHWGGYPSPYSNLYFGWLNQVARELGKTHPDKLLGTLAYASYLAPPDDSITLDGSIIPYITFCIGHTHFPRYRALARKLVEAWGRRVDQIGLYDYAYGCGFVLPRIDTRLVQETMQHGVRHGVKGVYAEVYPNWGLDGPRLYVRARICWNPDVDADAVFNEWNERMFRGAAAPMKQYFRRAETVWMDDRNNQEEADFWIFDHYRGRQFEIYTPAVIREMTAYLDEAARLAESELVKARLRFFRKTWDHGVMFANAYWGGRGLRGLVEAEAPLERIAEAMRSMPAPMTKTDFTEASQAMVGDDSIAFYPNPTLRKIPVPVTPLPEIMAEIYGRCAARLVRESGRSIEGEGKADPVSIRLAVEKRMDKLFAAAGTPEYRKVVDRIRRLALDAAGNLRTAPVRDPEGLDDSAWKGTKGSADSIVPVFRAAEAPTIDGILDDVVWSRAEKLGNFTVTAGRDPARHATVARLAHDAKCLYVAVQCRQNFMELKAETGADQRDGDAWKDDSVEIFVRSANNPNTWAQLAINSAGALFDQLCGPAGRTPNTAESIAYDFKCDWAKKIYPDRWTVELAVPLEEFQDSPDARQELLLNIVRNVVGDGREASTWYPASTRTNADLINQGRAMLEPTNGRNRAK